MRDLKTHDYQPTLGPVTFYPVVILPSPNFGPVTDRQSNAYEPTVHKHGCAQKEV